MKAWITLLLATGLALMIAPVQAQNAAAERAERSLQQELRACRQIESSLERLDCYDRLVATQRSETPRGQQVADDVRSDDFGREHLGRPASDDDKRYVTIVESWQNPRGLWRFRTEEGAEWHQIESARNFRFESGARYYIERGAMNSFVLSHDDSNRSIRVRRVD